MKLDQIFEKAGDHLVVGRAFGTPIEKDGTVVVPVAFVAGGGGGGQGSDAQAQQGEGGGFGGLVYPIGVYSIRDGQVRFVPAVDVTRMITSVLSIVRLVVKSRTKERIVTGVRGKRRHAKRGSAT